MSYGRVTSSEELDPDVVQKLAHSLGLDVSSEEAIALTTSLLNQFAAMGNIERFDLHDIVPAPIFKMEGAWDE